MNSFKNIAIIGTGGFSRELKSHLGNKNRHTIIKIVTDLKNTEYESLHDINFDNYGLIIGIGDPNEKKRLYNKVRNNNIISYIDDENNLIDKNTINIDRGSIICKGAILTTNIKLGICNHINLNSTIGHDVTIGDFFTCSPGVNISGNCNIGNNVFIGTNSSIKEGVTICDDVIIGMNSNVVKDICSPGVYFGNPLINK